MRDGLIGEGGMEDAKGDLRDIDYDSIVRWLTEIKRFQQEAIAEFRGLLSGPSVSRGELVSFYNRVKSMEIFQPQSYLYLLFDSQLKGLVEHDLGNLATPAVSAKLDLSPVGKEGEKDGYSKVLRSVTHAVESMLDYSFVLEDLLIRRCGDEHKDGAASQCRRGLEWRDVLDVVSRLKNSGAVGGLVKQKLQIEVKNLTGLIKPDEMVETVPGIVVNSIFNIIRNGSKEGVQAKKVVFSIVRDGDQLIFRIVNDGEVMKPDKIDKENRVGAIYYGHSYTGGTGLGLGGILDRMKMAGAELDVRSGEKGGKAETVFEIRLPITKK